MFRQITSIAGPHFGEIRNIKPPLSGSIIVNSIIDFGKHTDKLEFAEGCQGIEQHCHCEPARTLVWQSPSNFGLHIVIQTVLLRCFLEFLHERRYVYSGDCHASVRTGSQ